jgi:hypothetical protein
LVLAGMGILFFLGSILIARIKISAGKAVLFIEAIGSAAK